jgi:MarR family transcriptional regulator, organic hydroperoxide resistance regulator
MEALGYITRQQRPTNKKNVYVYLTPQGRALKKKLVPLAEATNEVSTHNITASDVLTARRVLLAMIENLANDEISAAPERPAARKPK